MTTTTINTVNLHNVNFLKGLSSANFTAGSSNATSFTVTQSNHGFSVGQILYFNGSIYSLASASSIASSETIGIISSVQDTNNFTVLTSGLITGLTGLTAGQVYFLSDTIAGGLQSTDITTPSHVSLPLFVATSTTGGLFYKQRGIVVPNFSQVISPYLSGRNRLINGEPVIAQRGAGGAASFTFSAAAGYAMDRWQVKAGTATSATVSQVKLANGVWAAVVNRTTGNAGTGLIQWTQSLTSDQCKDLAGRLVTLQLKANANAGFTSPSQALTLKIVAGTGTTDVSHLTTGFTGASTLVNSTITLTSTQQTFAINFTPPAGTTQLYFEASFSGVGTAPANDGFTITDQQMEIGGVATTFERKTFNQNLLECLPYYEKSYLYGTPPKTNLSPNYAWLGAYVSVSTNYNLGFINYRVQKIASPVVNFYGITSSGASYVSYVVGAQTFNDSTAVFALVNASPLGFGVICTSGSFGASYGAGLHYTADADLT